jgi:hypothetical protein
MKQKLNSKKAQLRWPPLATKRASKPALARQTMRARRM